MGHDPGVADARLPADHGGDSVPYAGPSGGVAELYLAGSGSGAGVSAITKISGVLVAQSGWEGPLGAGGSGDADYPATVEHAARADAAVGGVGGGYSPKSVL